MPCQHTQIHRPVAVGFLVYARFVWGVGTRTGFLARRPTAATAWMTRGQGSRQTDGVGWGGVGVTKHRCRHDLPWLRPQER